MLVAMGGCLAAANACAQDWTLTDEEREQLARGEVLVFAHVDPARPEGEVRAAVQIAATREHVFRTLTDCGQALEYVPHLERCRVLERAPDDSWQVVEHAVDYRWYMPRIDYVFRAAYEPFERIRFTQVRGDLKVNEGAWELMPADEAATSTVVTYRVQMVPRFYVPRRLILSSVKRDLPELLRALRARCEAPS